MEFCCKMYKLGDKTLKPFKQTFIFKDLNCILEGVENQCGKTHILAWEWGGEGSKACNSQDAFSFTSFCNEEITF